MRKAVTRDLITAIADKGMSEEQAEIALKAVTEVIAETLLKEKKVSLLNLGTFVPVFKDRRVKSMFGKDVEILPKVRLKFIQSGSVNKQHLINLGIELNAAGEMKKFRDNFI